MAIPVHTVSMDTDCDILIIGGGINGVGLAWQAARAGWRVMLCEQGDLGGATSGASSKLIHGGLRYLQYGAFRLVREALRERETLLRLAPHLVTPLRFVLPAGGVGRPLWQLRGGIWLYQQLAGRSVLPAGGNLPPSAAEWQCLRPGLERGLSYWDCQTQDSRLVVAVARAAAGLGASIHTRQRVECAERGSQHWTCRVVDDQGQTQMLRSRVLVNAAGPWAAALFGEVLPGGSPQKLRLVQGSHLVLPRLYAGDWAYALPQQDGRLVFVLPFEGQFTLVGTTETACPDPAQAQISAEEEAYLLAAVNRYWRGTLTADAIVWRYCGVRPLLEDGARNASAATREYRLDLNTQGAPLLSMFGGKLTTFRALAQRGVALLHSQLPAPLWREEAPLPGGDFPAGLSPAQWAAQRYPDLEVNLRQRLVSAYGRDLETWLPTSAAARGEPVAPGLFAAELEHLVLREWARSADDVLWRRSKLGLIYTSEERQQVADWLAQHLHESAV